MSSWLQEYLTKNMVNTIHFTDIELDSFLHFLTEHGMSLHYVDSTSLRNPEFHYVSMDASGHISKCSYRKGRNVVEKEQAIKDFSLNTLYPIFTTKEVIPDNKKVLNVYCSGAPNYFIFGVESKTKNTYSFISNQYWIRSSTNLAQSQIDAMILVNIAETVFVN